MFPSLLHAGHHLKNLNVFSETRICSKLTKRKLLGSFSAATTVRSHKQQSNFYCDLLMSGRLFIRDSNFCSTTLRRLTSQINNCSTEKQMKNINGSLESRRKVGMLKEMKEQFVEQKEAFGENLWTVPNGLCVARIVLSPIIAALVVWQFYTSALILFVSAAATDLIDGYIARRFPSQQSFAGSILDPVADKMLVSFLFLSLTYVHLIPLWLTVLVILRDVSLMTGGFILRYRMLEAPKTLSRYFDPSRSVRVRPTRLSKFNTLAQLNLVAVCLAAPVFGFAEHSILPFLHYFTAGTTVVSGLSYLFVKDTMEAMKKHK